VVVNDDEFRRFSEAQRGSPAEASRAKARGPASGGRARGGAPREANLQILVHADVRVEGEAEGQPGDGEEAGAGGVRGEDVVSATRAASLASSGHLSEGDYM
jgi:hypothetical protein